MNIWQSVKLKDLLRETVETFNLFPPSECSSPTRCQCHCQPATAIQQVSGSSEGLSGDWRELSVVRLKARVNSELCFGANVIISPSRSVLVYLREALQGTSLSTDLEIQWPVVPPFCFYHLLTSCLERQAGASPHVLRQHSFCRHLAGRLCRNREKTEVDPVSHHCLVSRKIQEIWDASSPYKCCVASSPCAVDPLDNSSASLPTCRLDLLICAFACSCLMPSCQDVETLVWSEWFNSWFIAQLFCLQVLCHSQLNGSWPRSLVARVVCLLRKFLSIAHFFDTRSHICSLP